MEWLAGNIGLAYPFADDAVGLERTVFADALVVSPIVGPLTLTTFNPLALTNAVVEIRQGATTVLSTATATVTDLGGWVVLTAADTARGSSYRFILDSMAVTTFPFLISPVTFLPSVVVYQPPLLQSLNGLTGDIVVDLPNHIQLSVDDHLVTVDAQAPVDRIDCSSVDCAQVFALNHVKPDQFGSLVFGTDGCHRIVPHPTDPAKLLLYNFCTPCLDCADVQALNGVFATQADYYHQLSAIYHDQFNRYQRAVAAANTKLADVESRADGSTVHGIVMIDGRAFDRPYFTQLALYVTNGTAYQIQADLSVSVSPSALATAFSPVPGAGVIVRYLLSGRQFDTFDGFPGSFSLTVDPQTITTVGSELHLISADPSVPRSGQWNVSAIITFLSGPAPLPDPLTITKTFPITLLHAEVTYAPP